MRRETVYIAHPMRGDVEGNKAKVRAICYALAIKGEVVPCAPYLEACEYLEDSISYERDLGIGMNEQLIIHGAFDKIWLYGDRMSDGMVRETILAWDLGIPVIPQTEGTAAALLPLICARGALSTREAIGRYLMRTGPIGMDDLRRWVWKHFPGDIVVINKMIGEKLLRYHGGGLIGLCPPM